MTRIHTLALVAVRRSGIAAREEVDRLAARPGAQSGATMLDDTVVAVFSKMGRTPELNGSDHWPVTSAGRPR